MTRFGRMLAVLGGLAGLGLAACASDRPVVVESAPGYCPAPPAIPVNAQGLLLVPPSLRAGAVDWESTYAYRLQFSLASPASLAGKPAQTMQQLAQLEMLANSFARNIRFQTLPAFGYQTMRQGHEALRNAMGIALSAPDAQVVAALLEAECALWAGDRARARAALGRVAQAPDALDLVAPPGANSPPRIPHATAAAAANAAPAIRSMGGHDGTFWRMGRLF